MRRLFVSSALMLLALTPAIAQSTEKPHTPTLGIGNPGFAAPGTKEQTPGVPAPHLTNVPDRVFVIRATLGGAAEIELARLAEQKTRNDAVRDFARHMIRDHSQADNALSRLAEADGIPLPEEPDAKQREIRDGLSRLSGPEFDIEYLRVQVQNHQRMAQLRARMRRCKALPRPLCRRCLSISPWPVTCWTGFRCRTLRWPLHHPAQ